MTDLVSAIKMYGQIAVAKKLGFTVQRVNNWTRRGIPPRVILDNQKFFKKIEKMYKNL
jgi:hypothetical protein